MLRGKICTVAQDVKRRHRRTNSQFLKIIMEQEQKCNSIEAHEIHMTKENPMVVEKKLQTDICSELKEVKRNEILEQKRRTMLHSNEDEIRLLDVQIKRAQTQNELLEQKATKEKEDKEKREAREEENRRIQQHFKRNAEIILEEEQAKKHKKDLFRQDLLKQMKEQQEMIEKEKEQIRKERECMTQYITKLKKDDELEKERLEMFKRKTKQEMEFCLEQHQLHKQRHLEEGAEDLQNYKKIQEKRDEFNQMKMEKRRQAYQRRAAVSDYIGEHIFKLKRDREARENQLMELLIEERLAKDDEQYKRKIDQQFQTAQNLRKDMERYRLHRQHEQELKRQANLKANDTRLETYQQVELKEQKQKQLRTLKTKDYCQELLNTIAQRKAEQELEAREQQQAYQRQMDMAKYRQQEIEDEKLRLLQMQPRQILKYLPANAISEKHRQILGLTCKEK